MSATTTTGEVRGQKPAAHPRVVALLALCGLVCGAFMLARSIYYAVSDAWLAPIMLSPDNDMVLQINVKMNEQMVEHDKLQQDLARVDEDVRGVDVAIARLQTLDSDGKEALHWTSLATKNQAASLNEQLRSLTQQKSMLTEMLARETNIVDAAERNANAGLLSGQDKERELQILRQLQLTMAQNERDILQTKFMADQFSMAATALSAGAPGSDSNGRKKSQMAFGLVPEAASGADRDVRVELEIIKLQAERRELIAKRANALDGIKRMDEVWKQLRARPLYRAIEARTDVGFVPYTQLDGVEAGYDLVTCRWVLFGCRSVGRVSEVLSGEVIAQDPWSNIARGQYAILQLTDRDASKEKVLRARKPQQ